jgi:hypothetical protein
LPQRDEQGKPLWLIRKERSDSPQKIDLAMAAVLSWEARTDATALATETYAAQIFGKGTLNGGVIENPGLLNDEAGRRMAETFITRAGDWHIPKILEQGSKWVQNEMTPEDFQMILSRKFSIDDMARWLGVPRQMLENSDPSFGNAEQFDESFLTYSMGGWFALFEFAIRSQLILQPKKYYAEFTRDAIARGKLIDRWSVHVQAVNAGIKTVDEARAKEGLNKMGGEASKLRNPQNITGKGTAGGPDDNQRPGRTGQPAAPPTKAEAIVRESSARILRKETTAAQKAAVKHASDPVAWRAWVDDFYATHHLLVMESMVLDESTAKSYVALQRSELLEDGILATERWTPTFLASLALDRPTPDPMPGVMKALQSAIDKPAAPVTISAPVTIEKGAMTTPAVTMNAAPVTVSVDKGAIQLQHDTHHHEPPPPPRKPVRTTKTISRADARGPVTAVREQHEYADGGSSVTVQTVTLDKHKQIAQVVIEEEE